MALSFGSAQVAGLPVRLTLVDQVIHTAVAGAGTPQTIGLRAANTHTVPVTVTVTIENAGGTVIRTYTETVGLQTGLQDLLNGGELLLNNASVVKAKCSVAAVCDVYAIVGDQADTTAKATVLSSGLLTPVQNASRFRCNGIASSATEADHQIMLPAGTLTALRVKDSVAVTAGATITINARKNGAATALTTTLANADGTALKTVSAAVTVVDGDLFAFEAAVDNNAMGAGVLQIEADFLPA